MTTPQLPPLDRLITRQVTIMGAPADLGSFTWAAKSPSTGWHISSGRLVVPKEASDGTVTDLAGVSTVTIAGETYTVNLVESQSATFGRPAAWRFTFEEAGAGAAIDMITGALTASFHGAASIATVDRKIWAGRRDFPAGDFVDSTTAGLVNIHDSRYIVRTESGQWKAGDTFTDESGDTRRIEGVSEIGRRYLEILARRTG